MPCSYLHQTITYLSIHVLSTPIHLSHPFRTYPFRYMARTTKTLQLNSHTRGRPMMCTFNLSRMGKCSPSKFPIVILPPLPLFNHSGTVGSHHQCTSITNTHQFLTIDTSAESPHLMLSDQAATVILSCSCNLDRKLKTPFQT